MATYAAALPWRVQPDYPLMRKFSWMEARDAENVMVAEAPPGLHRGLVLQAIEVSHKWNLKDYDEHPRQAPVLPDRLFLELHTTLFS